MGLTDRLLGLGTAVSVVCVLVSIYLRDPSDVLRARLASVAGGLAETEHRRHVYTAPRVAVGYGACVDLYVEAARFLPYRERGSRPRHYDDILNLEQLYESYAYYFQHGAATERYMSNSDLFNSLVALADITPGSRYALGGNAPVMAIRLFKEGCDVLLGSSLTPRQKLSIPKDIKVAGPVITRDDIHLIIEYKAGEKWGPYITPRSNRYIIHNDVHNPNLTSFPDFKREIKEFNPDVLVVSGIQLMDNYPFKKGVREKKLNDIRSQILSVRKDTKIHFEMASFTESALLHDLQEHIVVYADSLGMNEQELANLFSLYSFGKVSFVSDSTPRVATVLDQMRQIFELIRKSSRSTPGSRKLSRIHVHTLAYQAILTDVKSSWKQSDVAAAKASLTAYRHVCASPQVELEKAELLMDDSFSTSVTQGKSNRVRLIPEHPVSCWKEKSNSTTIELCVAPGLVCTSAAQTAGGGDNISAAALAMQL